MFSFIFPVIVLCDEHPQPPPPVSRQSITIALEIYRTNVPSCEFETTTKGPSKSKFKSVSFSDYHMQGSTWVKNEVRHGLFKSCRSPTWAFIKIVESDVKAL